MEPDFRPWDARAGQPSVVDRGGASDWGELLQPLQGFGLLERRDRPPQSRPERAYQLRKTPLFDRFLRFDFVDPPVWTGPRRLRLVD